MPLVPNFLAMVSDLVKNPEKFDKFIKKVCFGHLTFSPVITLQLDQQGIWECSQQ